jgi:thiosulfate dehydrogenase (quinone) large subunit
LRSQTLSVQPDPGQARATSLGLAAARVMIGAVWLHEAHWKIPPNFGVFRNWVERPLEFPVFAPYNAIVEAVILPNFLLFAWTVLLLEAALGAFLVVGLATRLFALLGLAMTFPIFFSVANYSVTGEGGRTLSEWPSSYYMMMALHLAVLLTAAGRHYGLDGVLRDRWRADELADERAADRVPAKLHRLLS